MAEWITRLPSKQEVPGSDPIVEILKFSLV